MYAAIRRYRVNPKVSDRVVRRILEDFAPLIEEKVPGLSAYYVLDAENGVFATLTICESKETLEECSRLASQWIVCET